MFDRDRKDDPQKYDSPTGHNERSKRIKDLFATLEYRFIFNVTTLGV
jgi:hypothetical protein